jgi:hypothetical protein
MTTPMAAPKANVKIAERSLMKSPYARYAGG